MSVLKFFVSFAMTERSRNARQSEQMAVAPGVHPISFQKLHSALWTNKYVIEKVL